MHFFIFQQVTQTVNSNLIHLKEENMSNPITTDNKPVKVTLNLPRFSRHLSQTKTEQAIEQKTASQKGVLARHSSS